MKINRSLGENLYIIYCSVIYNIAIAYGIHQLRYCRVHYKGYL